MVCRGCQSTQGVVEPNGYHATCAHWAHVCQSVYCKAIIVGNYQTRLKRDGAKIGVLAPADIQRLKDIVL